VRDISKERDEMREVLESQEQQLQELSDQLLGQKCIQFSWYYSDIF
jgi:hypothetical protein